VAKYLYPFKQGNFYPYPIRIRENCGYPQNIYPRIHIRASLAGGRGVATGGGYVGIYTPQISLP